MDLQAEGCVEYQPKDGPHLSSVLENNQFESLYQECRLTDLGSRLRFLICTQMEDSLSGLFPHCQFLPFGSSVNGFGCRDSDLDAFLNLDALPHEDKNPGLTFDDSFRRIENNRTRCQLTLEVLGEMMQNFFPCVSSMQRILRARVPILKFHHTITGIDTDISFSNGTGYHMSELLFLFGELDHRVRLLVFAVRRWARINHLDKYRNGLGISNFTLSILVIFFLQRCNPPILPTVKQLKDLAGPEDQCVFDGVDCTFIRTFTEIQKSTNTEDINSLLCAFFRFYDELNWKNDGISIVTGKIIVKPDSNPIYIQNPLEHNLNVSKNINKNVAMSFQSCLATTVREIEQNLRNNESLSFLSTEAGEKIKSHKGLNVSILFDKYSNVTAAKSSQGNQAKNPQVSSHFETVNLFDKASVSRQTMTRDYSKVKGTQRDRDRKVKNPRNKDTFRVTDLWKIF